jgi:acetyl esterase/lipase
MDIDQLRRPLAYHRPAMDNATCQRDVVYTHVNHHPLLMDVYAPPSLNSTTRLPGVLFVHGGPIPADLPLQPKDWGVFTGYGKLAAASGLIGITFNHSYYNLQHLPDASVDIQAAIQYVHTHADALHLDPDRLAIWAFSGGGPHLSPILCNMPPSLRCIAAYYTLLDLRHVRDQVTAHISDDLIEQFSPVAAVERGDATRIPMLLARAGQDRPMLNQSIDTFVQAALGANWNLTLLNHPEGHHAFDTLDNTSRTHEIITATVEFVQRYLAAA